MALFRKAHPNAINARKRELLAQLADKGTASTPALSFGRGLPEAVEALKREGYSVVYETWTTPASGFEPPTTKTRAVITAPTKTG